MKFRLLLIVLICSLLPGCSLLGEVNQSLDYVNQATAYINQVSGFSEQIPKLAEQAATDPKAKETLLRELNAMKEKILNFNALEAPAFAQDIHKKLLGYNETFLKEINGLLDKINSNLEQLDAYLENSQFFQTIDKITQTMNLIQQLGR